MAESSEGRKKKRGPYKQYSLNPDDDCYNPIIPKTTKWRRLHDNNDTIDSDASDIEGSTVESVGNENSSNENEAEVEVLSNSYNILFENMEDDGLPDNTDNIFDFLDDEQEDMECPDNSERQQEEFHESDHPQNNEDESNQYDVDQPLYENAPVTIGQCLLLLMAFILGNKLTGVAVGNLLRLLTMILPTGSRLPHTKYLFYKYFNIFKEGLEYKLFCPCCKALLETNGCLKCSICETDYERQKLLEQGNFFIYLPLEKQLQDLFQCEDLSSDLDYRFNRKKPADSIDDIYDGQMYKSLGNGALATDRNAMSVSFSCDGVPVFRSSNFSIWPLQGILNELPPKKRKLNVFLIGLWFGIGKPTMVEFLEPFTKELRRLSSTGMRWLRNGQEVCSRVFACICSCDSVARCALQNIHQFNGVYGCSWCYNPGTTIEKGRGHTRVYLGTTNGYDLRTKYQMNEDAHTAFMNQETVHGVKGPSKLLDLPHFDTVRGFVVDNLHCVDLGVSRQLGHLWFDSANHRQPWYLGKHIPQIDARLRCIMPPHEITRIPRSVTQRAYWKGSEWHWWLLLYCPVILHGLLPLRYFRHILLLVQGVFLLTKSSIRRSEINKAQACLSKFVNDFQQLYGEIHMSYNVHQLDHLTQTVIDWGPLSGYSTYVFEGFNLVLLKLFHGTQAIPSQIANSFLLYRALNSISSSSSDDGGASLVLSFMDTQLKGHVPLKKARRIGDKIALLGASYSRDLSIEERYLIESHTGNGPNGNVQDAEFFTKVVVDGNMFHCQNYTRNTRRKNCIVGLVNGTTVELVVFVLIGDLCFAFAKPVHLDRPTWLYTESECGRLCDHIRKVCGVESALQIVELNDISDKYTFIHSVSEQSTLSDAFICKLPNVMDRD